MNSHIIAYYEHLAEWQYTRGLTLTGNCYRRTANRYRELMGLPSMALALPDIPFSWH